MLNVLLVIISVIKPVLIPTQSKRYNFAVIGDTQINKKIMRRAAKNMRSKNLKFVAHVGDVDWCGYVGKWKKSKKIMSLSLLPWFLTIGNHELYSCGWPPSIGYTKKQWSKYWWNDKSTYHSFTYGGKKFIFTDSSTFLYPKNHQSLLKKDLKNSKNKSVFIFTHRPFAYHNASMLVRYGFERKYWNKYWVMGNMSFIGRNKIIWRLLKNYKKKIIAIFHGHYHAYRSYTLDGIPVYCTGGGGGSLETKRDFYHYLIVKVRKNNIIVKVVRI